MSLGVIALDDHELGSDTDEENINLLNKQRARLKRHHKKCVRTTQDRMLTLKLEQLRRRNAVMETLCGFGGHSQNIVDSAISIQAAVRGWILRSDKQIFDRCLLTFLNQCRMVVQRRRFQCCKASVLKIQSSWRAFNFRMSPTGKAIRAVVKYKNDIAVLERLALKLTSLVYPHTIELEKTPILIE